MKYTYIKIMFVFTALIFFTACENNDIPIFDSVNGRAIAGFADAATTTIVFNPTENTERTYTVGVSTVSSSDRLVKLSINNDTSLDSKYYEISTLNPVIPAGEFATSFTVKTLGSTNLPPSSAIIVIDLISVEESEILEDSRASIEIGLSIECSSFDASKVSGSYRITALGFFNFFGETDTTREIIAGPGANQFTIIDGTFKDNGAEDLIFTVDSSGNVTAVNETKLSVNNAAYGPNTYLFINGRVLSCAGIVEFNLDFGGSIQGNSHSYKLLKQ